MRLLADAPRFLLLAAVTVASALPAYADGRVDVIEVGDSSSSKGDAAAISIRSTSFQGKRPEFSLFRLQNPARVVVDGSATRSRAIPRSRRISRSFGAPGV